MDSKALTNAHTSLEAAGWKKDATSCSSCGGGKENWLHADKPGKKIVLMKTSLYFYLFEGVYCTKADYLLSLTKALEKI